MPELIKTYSPEPYISIIEIHRPKELNALNPQVMGEIRDTLLAWEKDDNVRVIIITGNERAFAAGADIKQMADKNSVEMLLANQFESWEQIRKTRKPIIAAVSGFALGGGCELALMCDMIMASETAQFGQPEVKIGTIPGAGGTQRLTRAIGKVKAMELILTGNFISAEEALQLRMINRIVPVEMLLPETIKVARQIAQLSPVAVMLAKEAINRSYETHLDEGLAFERKNFYLTFSSADQKEGMKAFIEKRAPKFEGK